MDEIEFILTLQKDQKVIAQIFDPKDKSYRAPVEGALEMDDLRLKTVKIFADLITQGKMNSRDNFAVLGEHLYRSIFHGQIADLFDEALRKATDKINGQGWLPFKLNLGSADPIYANLPWEYLYDKDGFLATRTDLTLSRFLSPGKPQDPGVLRPEELPLRILVIPSAPNNPELGAVDADNLGQILDILKVGKPVDVQFFKERATENKIIACLQGFNDTPDASPHILHFIAHGRYDTKRGQGQIALINPATNEAQWCPDFQFANIINSLKQPPRLVFLQMCESGQSVADPYMAVSEFRTTFSGFAPQLISKNIPAVVAMQHPISNTRANQFSQTFYEALFKGSSIDMAVQNGRKILASTSETEITRAGVQISHYGEEDRVFATPVVYMFCRGSLVPQQTTRGDSRSRGGPSLGGETPRMDQAFRNVVVAPADSLSAVGGSSRGGGEGQINVLGARQLAARRLYREERNLLNNRLANDETSRNRCLELLKPLCDQLEAQDVTQWGSFLMDWSIRQDNDSAFNDIFQIMVDEIQKKIDDMKPGGGA